MCVLFHWKLTVSSTNKYHTKITIKPDFSLLQFFFSANSCGHLVEGEHSNSCGDFLLSFLFFVRVFSILIFVLWSLATKSMSCFFPLLIKCCRVHLTLAFLRVHSKITWFYRHLLFPRAQPLMISDLSTLETLAQEIRNKIISKAHVVDRNEIVYSE